MLDTISSFSDKAEIYEKYRWKYASHAIDAIFEISKIASEAIVADIGAGTGMLSQHFIGRAKKVFAIEPNAEMRHMAEETLGPYPNFISINGCSHATTLPDHSVDLITVGRAIHWFHPESTKTEFLRILKPDGWLAILQVPCTNETLLQAIKSIRIEENGCDVRGDKSKRDIKPLSFYYGNDSFLVRHFPATVQESWPEFLGRLRSLSPAPGKGHPRYPNFERAARKIFDRFSDQGCLEVALETHLSVGRVNPA